MPAAERARGRCRAPHARPYRLFSCLSIFRRERMPRNIKCGLIQCHNPINDETKSVKKIQAAALAHHLPYIHEAGKAGVKILCLQEIFNGPYFCPSQDARWYDAAETVPGPTTDVMAKLAKKYQMVMIVPVYEKVQAGILYNSAAVIDADGTYLGKYMSLIHI